MYAIVRAGGRQEKVAVGDLVELDRCAGEPGSAVNLPVLLLVDGEEVIHDSQRLSKVSVAAEIVDHHRGPKIDIGKFKNKTNYRRRQGHRQELTTLKITSIDSGK
ncbi:MAG: 50S ribosomal protein L21 [Candidatus Nanopelagicales bacterium]|nr:50S ribosomal protein L21 [Candidatus Nanopelagicales bacterium]